MKASQGGSSASSRSFNYGSHLSISIIMPNDAGFPVMVEVNAPCSERNMLGIRFLLGIYKLCMTFYIILYFTDRCMISSQMVNQHLTKSNYSINLTEGPIRSPSDLLRAESLKATAEADH